MQWRKVVCTGCLASTDSVSSFTAQQAVAAWNWRVVVAKLPTHQPAKLSKPAKRKSAVEAKKKAGRVRSPQKQSVWDVFSHGKPGLKLEIPPIPGQVKPITLPPGK
jgi:hypothetical protein